MHQNNQSLPNSNGQSFILRHLFMVIAAVIFLAVLYIETRNISAVGFAAVLLVLAHIVAVLVILYAGRSLLRSLIYTMHGQPVPQSHGHSHDDASHGHSHHHMQTEGVTISWAWFYDIFVRMLFASRVKTMMRSTVTLANIQPGEKVLDVGCGTGTLAILAKRTSGKNAEIHGIDASPEMIERALQKARKSGVAVDFNIGLVEDIHFPDATFDLVMNSLMMHHLPGDLKEKALAEIYRVLKPGGRLLIVDFEPPKKGLYRTILTMFLGQMTAIDNTRIPPVVEKSGFTQVKIGPTESPIATYISGIKPSA